MFYIKKWLILLKNNNRFVYFIFISLFFNFSIKSCYSNNLLFKENNNENNKKIVENDNKKELNDLKELNDKLIKSLKDTINTLDDDEIESGSIKFSKIKEQNYLDDFNENGYAEIKINNKYGLIYKNGEIILKPIYDNIFYIKDKNLIGFTRDDLKVTGFFDIKTKKEIIIYNRDEGYSVESYFSEGLVSLKFNEKKSFNSKCGYINEKNEIIIPLKFSSCSNFSNDRAIISYEIEPKKEINDKPKNIDEEYDNYYTYPQSLEKKYFAIDKNGKLLFEISKDETIYNYDGYKTGFILLKNENNEYKLLDKEGKTIFKTSMYDEIILYEKGILNVKKDDKWGYINKDGTKITEIIFDGDSYFFDTNNGKNALVSINNNKFYINEKGNLESFIPKFPILPLEPKKNNNLWGFVDEKQKFVIKPQFEKVSYCFDNFCAIKLKGKWGYVSKKGMEIEPQFEIAYRFSNGIALVKKDNDYHYIDKTGKIITSLSKLKKLVNEGKI